MALDAWRTLATHSRQAAKITAVPLAPIVAGTCALLWALASDVATPDGVVEPLGPYLTIAAFAFLIYFGSTLHIFVSWVRVLLRLQPAAWVWVGSYHANTAPIWLFTLLAHWFVATQVSFFILIPATLVLSEPSADVASSGWNGGALAWATSIASSIAWTAAAFATAPLLLRVSLRAAGSAGASARARVILDSWPRAAVALAVASLPLSILTVPVFTWALHSNGDAPIWTAAAWGIVLPIAATLLAGAICADLIRPATHGLAE
jgi:hypothetical protein